MRQLAVGAVGGSPFFDQFQHCLAFPLEDPMDPVAARSEIFERAQSSAAGPPSMHPHIGDLENPAGAGMRPACAGDGSLSLLFVGD
jgi:hypothetical protein